MIYIRRLQLVAKVDLISPYTTVTAVIPAIGLCSFHFNCNLSSSTGLRVTSFVFTCKWPSFKLSHETSAQIYKDSFIQPNNHHLTDCPSHCSNQQSIHHSTVCCKLCRVAKVFTHSSWTHSTALGKFMQTLHLLFSCSIPTLVTYLLTLSNTDRWLWI